jgi:hypothetical protein
MQIEVASVHSVKGETHISTLYLKTEYYKKFESEYFPEQLKGKPYEHKNHESRICSTLKVAYVGFSRPRYLPCYAKKKQDLMQLIAKNCEICGKWK